MMIMNANTQKKQMLEQGEIGWTMSKDTHDALMLLIVHELTVIGVR